MTITLSKGGTKERTVDLDKLKIPDLWHIANAQDNVGAQQAILEVWHLAHDLRRALSEMERKP